MRIALRTSGGRGEYEVAGSQAGIRALDLENLKIIFELLPDSEIYTGNIIRHTQGKPRIRLEERRPGEAVPKHAYMVLADALLMPKPKRELSRTPHGKLQLVDNNFSVTSIQFDIIRINFDSIVVNPTNIILSNADGEQGRIDVVERMRILLNVWAFAEQHSGELSELVRNHKNAFFSGQAEAIFHAAKSIKMFFRDHDDPLRQIIVAFDISDSFTYWMGLHTTDVDSYIVDEDLSNFQEAARNRLKQWRLQADRGTAGNIFSKNVKEAYRHTCLFTGYFLPKTPLTGSPGVDSAHILPWAEFDLNSVMNGLCLSKLCHWAFDCGILRLNFDRSTHEYLLTIPDKYRQLEQSGKIDLSPFRRLVGVIPKSRLPENKNDWPKPEYINKYNESLDYTG